MKIKLFLILLVAVTVNAVQATLSERIAHVGPQIVSLIERVKSDNCGGPDYDDECKMEGDCGGCEGLGKRCGTSEGTVVANCGKGGAD